MDQWPCTPVVLLLSKGTVWDFRHYKGRFVELGIISPGQKGGKKWKLLLSTWIPHIPYESDRIQPTTES